MMKKLALVAFVVLTLGISSTAFATLIRDVTIDVTGTGLGAVNTLVTVHDPGGPGNQNGTESGGINQDGTFSPVTQFGIEGGDNTAINNVLLAQNIGNNFGAVVNVAETGQDLDVILTNLYLTFVGVNGTYTAQYTGGPTSLAPGGENAGTGGSGFVFILDPAEFAIVSALGPTVTISGGVQFANGSTNDGNETVYIIELEGGPPPTAVPEPGTLMLLGSGLIGLAGFARRRFRK